MVMLGLKTDKTAFTLAEVIIVIGIIGIVASMLIPGLVTNYRKKETVARLQVAYELFSSAFRRSMAENGDPAAWDDSDLNKYTQTYIVSYIAGAIKVNDRKGLSNYPMRTLSSQGTPSSNRYLDWSWNMNNRPIYEIPSKSILFVVSNANDGYKTIVVDINGRKGPNIMGIDGFTFWIEPQTQAVMPAGYKCSREQILGKVKGCVSSGTRMCVRDNTWQYYRGGYCAALLQKDDWKITKDYPWGNGDLTSK